MELYIQAYQQLASVSAVLGGLAFTAAAALLAVGASVNTSITFEKSTKLTIATALISATSLIVAALFWSFMSADIGRGLNSLDNDALAGITQWNWLPSMALLFGASVFFLSIGTSGWIVSRRMGILTSVLAAVGLVMLILMLQLFSD